MFLKMREKSEKQPTVMRTTAVGNGFVKEDVMKYIDELNVRLLSMEEQNQDLRKELEAARNRIRELENNK
ncbi:MAG: hypothetical protein IKQ91_02545 [Oscillospiraceae bacterium]|nr:hypothetical protein [Oscillospiraceae bacterium]